MAFRVQDFRAQMNYDGARPNLFQCELTFPTLTSGSNAQQKFTFMARAAQLPGSTVNHIPQFYFGRELKFAGNRTFPEWTITVINDEDFVIRNQLEEWMARINNHESNLSEAFYSQYAFDAEVYQYGKQGNIIKTYTFIDMFPVDISPIDVSWDANDAIEEFAVTFQYQYWTSAEVAVA